MMMEKFDIDTILQIAELSNELEFERANALQLKLRWMVKEDKTLLPIRNHLRALVNKYEKENWSDPDLITAEQIDNSDKAELIVAFDSKFIVKRKELIKAKLKQYDLNQADLAKILGHRNNYMSELINGVRPFSKDDIVILHRLLKIDLDNLISPFIKEEIVLHIKNTLLELNKTKLKLSKKDVELMLS